MIKELLEKLRYGVAVTEKEATIFRQWRKEQYCLTCKIPADVKGIDKSSLIAGIMGDIEQLCDRIKELESKKCKFKLPPNIVMPQENAPSVNSEQYYFYNHIEDNWYSRTFFTGASSFLRLKDKPQLNKWLNDYPLPQDIGYLIEDKK